MNSLYLVAPGSGHEIHLYQPERVVDAVVRVVAAIRNEQLLTGALARP